MGIERHFLSPDTPLPAAAAAYLARDWKDGNLDLGDGLVVVSSRQAGRRLREALAVLAGERGAAVFPPLVVTPEFLVTHGSRGDPIAAAADSRLAWAEVLSEIDFASFSSVFPSPPRRRDFSWSVTTGAELLRVKRLLAEGGLLMEDVSSRMSAGFADAARWRELGELERRYRNVLRRHGLRDAEEAKIACAENPVLPESVKRVILIAVPDPPSPALRALDRVSESLPIEVAIYADAGDEGGFDEWGRPRRETWEERITEFEEEVFWPCSGPADQAARAADLLRAGGGPPGSAAVGAVDGEVIPFLERTVPRRSGMPAFDPEGRPAGGEELVALLGLFRDLLRSPDFPLCGELIRCPVFSRYVTRQPGVPGLPAVLASWDAFARERLPGDLDDALALAGERDRTLRSVLDVIRRILRDLEAAPVFETLPGVLRTLHLETRFDDSRAADRRYISVAGEVMKLLDEFRNSPLADRSARGAVGVQLLLALLSERRIEEERPANAIDLQGWLELLWEDAPHLVLTGLNEGSVPETVTGEPFLPESLRRDLGLTTNGSRLARDRYILEILVRTRRRKGRVDLLFGRSSEAGEPLRPSRLLLKTRAEDLPDRVDRLFAEPPSPAAKPAWSSPWRLAPRAAETLERISVTQFGRYLRCPFRFYLSDVLRMEPVDPRKAELDDAEFGSVCHSVLETFGNEEGIKRSEDPAEIRRFFERELDRVFLARYGRNLSVPLMLQKESAAARLARLAAVQARERAEGWLIEAAEWRFPEDEPLRVAGLPLRGVIDRIERNERTGAYRIIDYKTSDRDRQPGEDHFAALKKGESPDDFPEYAVFDLDGKPCRWIGLQLPLYRWALRARFGDGVACGYFNLPKAVTETGVRLWDEAFPGMQEAALRCAEGVANDIRAGRFWPPARSVAYDDFEDLFFGSPDALIDSTAFTSYEK